MMLALIAKASAADPRLPTSSTPGFIAVAVVLGVMISCLVFVWYKHYGPGAAPDDAEKF
jgi:hypothetical protein